MFYCGIIFCFLAIGCATHHPSEYRYLDSEYNVNHIQQAVVILFERSDDGDLDGPTCTAFFITDVLLATARHCVEVETEQIVRISPGISIVLPNDSVEHTVGRVIYFLERSRYLDWLADNIPIEPDVRQAEVVAISEIHDLALLQVDGNYRSVHWLPIMNNLPRTAERVYSVGIPMGIPWLINEGMISLVRRAMSGRHSIIHQTHIAPGSSGGPLINNYGVVVGVNVAYVNRIHYLGMAEPSTYLYELYRAYIE